MVPRICRWVFALLILAVISVSPFIYKWVQYARFRGLHEVRAGVLYRSGQLNLTGLKRVIYDQRIRTVISLRAGEFDIEKEEEEYCRSEGINFYRLPPRAWGATDGSVPAEKGVQTFREVMSNPRNHPVLIHCFAGIHRSGAYCAVYRMEFEGWTNERAIAEMRTLGYSQIDDEWDVLEYLEKYQPRGMAAPKTPDIVRPANFSPER
jgi:protein tyrosine/serine phosphatase